jgi:hypothetical protein
MNADNLRMHADESVFKDLICFLENYDRTEILRKFQPAQYIWAGQEYNSLAAVMTGYPSSTDGWPEA